MTIMERAFIEALPMERTAEGSKRLLKVIDRMVNCLQTNEKEVVEAILQNEQAVGIMETLSWFWIKGLSEEYKAGLYDKRNEKSCHVSDMLLSSNTASENFPDSFLKLDMKKVLHLLAYPERNDLLPELAGDERYGVFITANLLKMHRTLQQSFTAYVFWFLKEKSMLFNKMVFQIGRDPELIGYLPYI